MPKGNREPSVGPKSDKEWRAALRIAVSREGDGTDGKPTKKLALIADKVVDLAVGGDVQAIKEIGDRLDGRPKQSVDMELDAGDGLMDLMREFSRTKGN